VRNGSHAPGWHESATSDGMRGRVSRVLSSASGAALGPAGINTHEGENRVRRATGRFLPWDKPTKSCASRGARMDGCRRTAQADSRAAIKRRQPAAGVVAPHSRSAGRLYRDPDRRTRAIGEWCLVVFATGQESYCERLRRFHAPANCRAGESKKIRKWRLTVHTHRILISDVTFIIDCGYDPPAGHRHCWTA
jgi:hypothetical protein